MVIAHRAWPHIEPVPLDSRSLLKLPQFYEWVSQYWNMAKCISISFRNELILGTGQRRVIDEEWKVTSEFSKKWYISFRESFDNVVARFHLDRKLQAQDHPDWLDTYPNNREGFRKWCEQLNDSAAPVLSSIHQSLMDAMKDVPCMSEFYRYIQWHNLAFSLTSDLQIPCMLLHYEDCSTRFEDVTNEFTDFLGLEQVGKAPEFINDKTYLDYYMQQDKRNIARFIREYATKPTWQNVQHYLSEYLNLHLWRLDDVVYLVIVLGK
ncbi:LOW QUALITY PROTEIN: hypothetical protein ACHAWO_011169 [Cyclotella atomus]|uniref:Sulfotransferase n=1 Tax=Cyclotella atomus TaxID=382360 RepID=A0ABD3QEY9_9STRA